MRLRGYSDDVPKPMVTIGARPILWHLMKYYAHFGHKDFVLCLGYKGNAIKDYFLHYDESISNNFVWSEGGKNVRFLNRDIDDWTITFVETGTSANIGQRLKAVEPYVASEDMFLANYGDGLSDLHLPTMIETFRQSSAIASLLLVQPTGSSDVVHTECDGIVREITPLSRTGIWINGGFFVCEPSVLDYIEDSSTVFEVKPLTNLALDNELMAYKHHGFWKCMDTNRDRMQLIDMWSSNNAKWKLWE